jgi:hypothetical protein
LKLNKLDTETGASTSTSERVSICEKAHSNEELDVHPVDEFISKSVLESSENASNKKGKKKKSSSIDFQILLNINKKSN